MSSFTLHVISVEIDHARLPEEVPVISLKKETSKEAVCLVFVPWAKPRRKPGLTHSLRCLPMDRARRRTDARSFAF